MLRALGHIRRMRGGAQSHLMRCQDGHYYVVKFQNNPQHTRVLANELLATKLAERIGLPVPVADVVEVSDWLREHTPELSLQMGQGGGNGGVSHAAKLKACPAGMQFGARYVVDPLSGQVFDYLPEGALEKVKNLKDFAGMLCLDKWTCNANGRQAVFWRRARERKYSATFIDQGYCFNAGEWNFPNSPLRGVYARNDVYAKVTGWQSFEPWLSAIETMSESTIAHCADGIPPEWYGDPDDLVKLLAQLVKRRERVRELIAAFRDSSRAPFPMWKAKGFVN